MKAYLQWQLEVLAAGHTEFAGETQLAVVGGGATASGSTRLQQLHRCLRVVGMALPLQDGTSRASSLLYGLTDSSVA